MARWQLTTDHYLFGYPPDMIEEGIEWEYKETDRTTGRERRKRFKVPFYMEKDRAVCHEGKGLPSDIVFEGAPTYDMIPLDEEAKKISSGLPAAQTFDQAFPSQGAGGFSDALLAVLEKKLSEIVTKVGIPQAAVPVADSGVSRDEFAKLSAQVNELLKQNAALQAKLLGEAPIEPEQVIDDLEPLPPDGFIPPPPKPTPEHKVRRA